MKLNQKQLIYTLAGLIIGVFLIGGGLISSGAGHGAYPRFSILVAVIGGVMSIISIILLITSMVFSLFGKSGFPTGSNYVQKIPDYNWRCPKCDTVVLANTGDCLECKYSIASKNDTKT